MAQANKQANKQAKGDNPKFNPKYAIVDRFIEQIQDEADGDFKKGWKRIVFANSLSTLPHNAYQGNVYRGMNLLFLGAALSTTGYADPRFMTLRQAEKKFFPEKSSARELVGLALSLESFAEALEFGGDERGTEKARDTADKARAMAEYIENADYKPGDKRLRDLARNLAYASSILAKHEFLEEVDRSQALALDDGIKKHTGVLKKGARSTMILVPVSISKEGTSYERANTTGEEFVKEVADATSKQEKDDENEQQAQEGEQRKGKLIRRDGGEIVRMLVRSIYHISDFQNLPEGYRPIDDNPKVFGADVLNKDDDLAVVDLIIKHAEKMGLEVERGGSEAFYEHGTNKVRIPMLVRFDNMAEAAHTLLHELTHATKASNVGLERSFVRKLNELQERYGFSQEHYNKLRYVFEEGVAELSAINMSRMCTLPFDHKNAHNYLKSWLIDANKALTGGLRINDENLDAKDARTGLTVRDLKELTYRMIDDASKAVEKIMQPGAENGLFQQIMALRDSQVKAHANEVAAQEALEKSALATEEKAKAVITEDHGAQLDEEIEREHEVKVLGF